MFPLRRPSPLIPTFSPPWEKELKSIRRLKAWDCNPLFRTFTRLEVGTIWLLLIYGKNVTENIPAPVLKQVKKVIEHD